MRLLIIRHAQSTNNAAWKERGDDAPRVVDPELTDLGRTQADLLGRMLAGLPEPGSVCPEHAGWRPSVLYTSLMLRAVITASILAGHTGAPVVGQQDLHETGGIFFEDPVTGEKRGRPGTTREDFARRFPALELPASVGSGGWWNRPFEEEAERIERAERVTRWVLGLPGSGEAATGTVGIVTHGAFYGFLVPRLLGFARTSGVRFAMYNTGCTLLDFGEEERRLVFHNRICHLPPDAVT